MRSGDIDRRIILQKKVITGTDPYGGEIYEWINVATVWAEVKQESGREFFNAGAIQSQRKVIFKLRWMNDITVLHRVIYQSREHDIHEVRELGRQAGLELHTTTVG